MTHLSSLLFEIFYMLRRFLENLRRTLFAQKAVIVVMTIAFLLFAGYRWGEKHFIKLLIEWGGLIQITAVLDSSTGEITDEALRQSLNKITEIKSVDFPRRDQILKEHENFSSVMGFSIEMPRVVQLSLLPALYSPKDVALIAQRIKDKGNFSKTFYSEGWVNNLYEAVTVTRRIAIFFGAVLLILLLLSIIALFRVAWGKHIPEISLLKIFGASRRSLYIPFIMEGMIIGAVAAFLAAILFLLLFMIIGTRTGYTLHWLDVSVAIQMLPARELLYLVLLGSVVAGAGSLFATKELIKQGR